MDETLLSRFSVTSERRGYDASLNLEGDREVDYRLDISFQGCRSGW